MVWASWWTREAGGSGWNFTTRFSKALSLKYVKVGNWVGRMWYEEASYEAGKEDAKKLAITVNRSAAGHAAGKSLWRKLREGYPSVFGWLKSFEGDE